MTCGIYEITNKRDGTVYIGQSMNIERRWAAHKHMNRLNTCSNLKPTLELYNENPELVDFEIIIIIYPELYSEEELKFLLSVHEKHEISLRGGLSSSEVINERAVGIPAVPPTILMGDKLPEFVDSDDVLNSLVKWVHEEKMSVISKKIEEEVYRYDSPQDDFQLQQRVYELEDEVISLKNQVDFWKSRCAHWRGQHG